MKYKLEARNKIGALVTIERDTIAELEREFKKAYNIADFMSVIIKTETLIKRLL